MSVTPPRLISFAELSQLVGEYRELGHESWTLLVRTVATRFNGKWWNFGTSASLVDGKSADEKIIRLREDVTLVEAWTPGDRPLTVSELGQRLTVWRKVLGAELDYPFQEGVYLNREYSDPRHESWPRWSANLYEQVPGNPTANVPDGPFLSVSDQLFAPDIPRLASRYLGGDRWGSRNVASNEYLISIPDRRARIGEIRVADDELIINIKRNTTVAFFLSVVAVSYSGQVFERVLKVDGEHGRVKPPFAVQTLDLWISLSDGYALDHYHESPHRCSWGPELSLFNRPARSSDRLLPLTSALAGGESETVEFKPYIRFRPRDSKADELLETVSAFTNASGGDIYIGVTDHGEPKGVERELSTDYGKECRDSVQCKQDAYVRDLKKLITEGLTPAIAPEIHWHEIAHRSILQVRVPTSSTIVSLITNGDVFRRAGATNRKLRPGDLL